MSGERVVLAGAAGGNATRLVRATARLEEADLGPHALIGGLAVMCRLAAVHRVTQDIDAVTKRQCRPEIVTFDELFTRASMLLALADQADGDLDSEENGSSVGWSSSWDGDEPF